MKHFAKFFVCLAALSFIVAMISLIVLICEMTMPLLAKITLTALITLTVGCIGALVTL